MWNKAGRQKSVTSKKQPETLTIDFYIIIKKNNLIVTAFSRRVAGGHSGARYEGIFARKHISQLIKVVRSFTGSTYITGGWQFDRKIWNRAATSRFNGRVAS